MKVNLLYQNYARRFLKEWEQPGRYNPSLLVDNETDIVQDQLDFVRLYIGHIMVDGDFKENEDRIKRFLDMQGARNRDKKTELRFLFGYPIECFVFVDDLDDVDIADVMGITEFTTMHVYLKNGTWTQETSADFVEAVKEDLNFDGIEAILTVRTRKNLLEIKLKVA